MEKTKSKEINEYHEAIHQLILEMYPNVNVHIQPGYRSTSYRVGNKMKDTFCYIICYDQHANLGFPNGVKLQREFPFLKGNGKTHRHLEINAELYKDISMLKMVLKRAFELQKN